ncbi:MAG: hypothetical protein IJW98_02170 [Clostridia bacterium]|nr:hypothetical protein [Clostridia bacterium]
MDQTFGFSVSFPEFETIDFYKEARDSFLIKKFPKYPELVVREFVLSFSISASAKNAPLIFSVFETLPKESYSVNKKDVAVSFQSEESLLCYLNQIFDLLLIVKAWKSTRLSVNEVDIRATTEFGYLVDFLCEKNQLKRQYFRRTIDEVKKKYNTRNRTVKQKDIMKPVILSKSDVDDALERVIGKYVEIYGHNKEIVYYTVSKHDRIIVIEDNLIVDFRVLPWYWTRERDEYTKAWDFPYIFVQELTHNDLFKFNFADFRRRFQYEHIGLDFFSFHGVHYYRKEIDNYDDVDKKLPELKLQERNEKYPGELHHFVVLRMEAFDGNIVYGIGDTKGKVHSFILKLCTELEEKNSRTLELNGASCLPFNENQDFVSAFLSWKGQKKKWRLENKFSYFYEDRLVKNDLELYDILDEIKSAASKGTYDAYEFGHYNKPINRWKSEELVYNITKELYKDYQVIYQYKPFFLNTEKGNMSYDIYICGLKIAIEYQGKQHFEPVDYFGGEENFLKQKERDELKAKRSAEHGVKLIYVNYWEDLTPDLIRGKIERAIRFV